MSEWIEKYRQNPPQEGVIVELLCDDFRGEYIMKGKRKNYKKGSSKSQLRRGWRWVKEDETPLSIKEAPIAYRLISKA